MRNRLFISLAALALLTAAGRAEAADAECRVVGHAGAVQILRASGAVLVNDSTILIAADAVRTGSNGKLVMDCSGGLEVVIGPGTEIRIERYLVQDDGRLDAMLRMAFGIVRLLTGEPRPNRMVEIETRAAVASVRSTEWLVEATPAGTGVLAIENRVEVTGAGVTVVLEPGQGTDVVRGQPPSAPKMWGEARRVPALARTTL